MGVTYSVVIPARNAQRTLGAVLERLQAEEPYPERVIVVDDSSTDETVAVAKRFGVEIVCLETPRRAGGARNAGWERAESDYVVFLDADAVPDHGWTRGLVRALEEHEGAIVGCARTFDPRTSWGWVAHLQVETPYLPEGEPRPVPFVSSYCMAVPRAIPLRWDESYGGEDALFSIRSLELGYVLVFDPRFTAFHDHDRTTFRALRAQQRRLAYGLARYGHLQREGIRKRVASRVPLHYFALIRLMLIWRRIRRRPDLRSRFLQFLPLLIIAEWTLGISACRYILSRPALEPG
jgi:cellulose synthase/poly-beta-1,6-N-acetylglucosamine synthase-like glycosyltransferase